MKRPMTVGKLRALLAEHPDYFLVDVRVVVGGDLDVDDVALLELQESPGGACVVLVPEDCDEYDVRGLINDGLHWRARGRT